MPLDPCAQSADDFLNPLIGSARPDDLVPALLLLQSWLGSAKGPPALSKPPAGGSPVFCFPEPERSHQMLVANMQIKDVGSFRRGVEQRSRPSRKGNKSGMELVAGAAKLCRLGVGFC